MSLYLSFPSAKDPTVESRFLGRSTAEVITFVPYEWFGKWERTAWTKRGDEYDAFKARFTERLTEALYRYVPGTRGRVARVELSTPLSTRHFTNHPHGEVYGLAATPARFRLRALGPTTPIRQLYLTGADAAVLGFTGALSGAVLCASAILRKNVFATIAQQG
jgi:all-trans-retinol 13,14-reductase